MEYFCNVLLTTVAFYLFFYIGAMGAGDVKRNLWDRLCYLGEYVWDVVRCGRWKAYFAEERAHPASGICMAGPVFCSVLLYIGGVY